MVAASDSPPVNHLICHAGGSDPALAEVIGAAMVESGAEVPSCSTVRPATVSAWLDPCAGVVNDPGDRRVSWEYEEVADCGTGEQACREQLAAGKGAPVAVPSWDVPRPAATPPTRPDLALAAPRDADLVAGSKSHRPITAAIPRAVSSR
jgi:hypothetical protein